MPDTLFRYEADYIIRKFHFCFQSRFKVDVPGTNTACESGLALAHGGPRGSFGKDHLNQFAYRAIAARRSAYKTALGPDGWLGIHRGSSQARDFQCRHIVDVVAHKAY